MYITIAALLALIGIVLAVINGEYRSGTFWMILALVVAVIFSGVVH